MSGTVIVGSSGGHMAVHKLFEKSSQMTHEQRSQAQDLLDEFIANVEALCADVK